MDSTRRLQTSLLWTSGPVVLTVALFGCIGDKPPQRVDVGRTSPPPAPLSVSGDAEPRGEPGRELMALPRGGVVSLKLGDAKLVERKEKTLEFEVHGAQVTIGEHATLPSTEQHFVDKFGARILKKDRSSHHLALAMRVQKSKYADETNEVLAFTQGLICIAENIPDGAVDSVFEFCASLRPGGDILDYARRPEIQDTELLGLPTVEIATHQFTLDRIEWSEEIPCDSLTEMGTDYKREVSRVEVLKMRHGDVRTYWSVDPNSPDIGSSKVWAVRGKYCCGALMTEWFEHASRDDLRALANICDQVEQPGWPEDVLPEPISLDDETQP